MLLGVKIFPIGFRRGVKRGLKNVVREQGWGMSLVSLFGVLLLGQMLLLLVFGVHAGLEMLRENTDLRLEILSTAADAQIQDLYQNIRQLPYVSDAVYITREQAFERQKQRDPELVGFLTKFGMGNPFPETLGVRLSRLEDYPAFIQFLKQPVFSGVINPNFLSQTTDQEQQVHRLTDVVSAARSMLLLIMGVLLVVVLFVVVELVRRRAIAKREELFVEQLVGADRSTIFLPFCTEMVSLLMLALLLSIVFAAGLVFLLPWILPALSLDGMFASWAQATFTMLTGSLPWLVLVELVTVIALGVFGTMIALQTHIEMSVLPKMSAQ